MLNKHQKLSKGLQWSERKTEREKQQTEEQLRTAAAGLKHLLRLKLNTSLGTLTCS